MWYPQTSLVVLRIVVGAWFLKALWTKVTLAWAAGVLPYPAVSPRFLGFQPKRVAEFASNNPIEWYKHFLEGTVLPHASLFATLQTYGEVVVGVGLLLGLLTRLSAGVGLFLAVNYGLATQWMTFGQQGFHVLLTTSMILLLMSGAGRLWGVDERLLPLAKRFPWLRVLL
jgi:thiosulfate dehydrogenase (quinone) large subunit